LPHPLRSQREELIELGRIYKRLNAPFGPFATFILAASTDALKSGSDSDDRRYTTIQGRIRSLSLQRDAVAAAMKTMLNAAAQGQMLNRRGAKELVARAEELIEDARRLGR
jgi:hypothetical protein